jgi:hypothetical protein
MSHANPSRLARTRGDGPAANVVAVPASRDRDAMTDAFSDLEPDICDLVAAAEIAFDMAMDGQVDGKTLFAIEQFKKLAEGLKEKYYRV